MDIMKTDETTNKVTVDCQHYDCKQGCTYYYAPRKLLGLPECVVEHPPKDRRLRGCSAQRPYNHPDGHPLGPPSRIQKFGSTKLFTL